MRWTSFRFLVVLTALLMLGGPAPSATWAQDIDTSDTSILDASPPSDTTVDADVPFVRTPQKIVNRMLELADVSENDVVYDLGSGDGRIPITAAQTFGAEGVGIEIKPDLVQKARRRATVAGVDDQVEFRQGDLFEADISEATVVTLYLLPDVNTRLRPKLFEELEPGTRVVSHGFDMDDWEADEVVQVQDTYLYLWTIPEVIPPYLKEQNER
jgi:SAM-dependent methyltransferase